MTVRSHQATRQRSSLRRTHAVLDTLESRKMLASASDVSFGVNFGDEALTSSNAMFEQAVARAHQLGAQAVRVWVGFNWNNRTFGAGSYPALNRIFRLKNEEHFNVMMILNPNANTSTNKSGPASNNLSEAREATTEVVTNLIKYRSSSGSQQKLYQVVDRWEIGNEVDSPNYWSAGINNYVDTFLEPAAEVLRANNSNEEIVTAGPSWNPLDMKKIIDELKNDGKIDLIDGAALHPYGQSASDVAKSSQDGRNIIDTFNQINGTSLSYYATEWNTRKFYSKDTADGYKAGMRDDWAQSVTDAFPSVYSAFDTNYYFALINNWLIQGKNGAARPAGAFIHSTENDKNTSLVKAPDFYNQVNSWQNGTLRGYAFADANSNGTKDGSAEAGVQNKTIYIDLNGNTTKDPSEPSATTAANGSYVIQYTTNSLNAAIVDSGLLYLAPQSSGYTLRMVGSTASRTFNANAFSTVDKLDFDTQNGSPPGYVNGFTYNDNNGNGIYDDGDVKSAGKKIFDDLDNDGILDTNEPSVTTDASGNFSNWVLSLGARNLRRAGLQTGFRVSTGDPVTQVTPLTVVTGQNTLQVGSTTHALVTGTVFNDVDGNGTKGTGEAGLSSWTVFYDTDHDGSISPGEEVTTTTSTGAWRLNSIPANATGTGGSRDILLLAKNGWTSTVPSNGKLTPTLTSAQYLTGLTFGVQVSAPVTGTLSGYSFNDNNGNGVYDSSVDSKAGSKLIYDDLNGNDAFDTGEPSVTTDTSGNYSWVLPAGTHTLRRQLPSGFRLTTGTDDSDEIIINITAGQTTTAHVGATTNALISGIVYNDSNGNGTQNTGENGLAGWQVYYDADQSGTLTTGDESTTTDSTGAWTLHSVPATGSGASGVRNLIVINQGGWTLTAPLTGVLTPTVASGQRLTNLTFGAKITTAANGTINGYFFNDNNGNGVKETTDTSASGKVIFDDIDQDGVQDSNETSITSDASGNFVNWSLPAGVHYIRRLNPPTGFRTSTAPASDGIVEVTVTVGQISTVAIGTTSLALLSGKVYNDVNGNGSQGTGENGLAGWTVYYDADNSGSFTTGEESTVTDSNGAWKLTTLPAGSSRVVRIVPQTGWTSTTPSTGAITQTITAAQFLSGLAFGVKGTSSISGQIWNDANDNGVKDTGETAVSGKSVYMDVDTDGVYDPGELSTTTDSSGNYAFTNLLPGQYVLRVADAAGWRVSSPADESRIINLAAGDTVSDSNFGITTKAAISGTIYSDVDGSGTREFSEAGLAAWTVYIDANANGQYDVGEVSTITDVGGDYTFHNLTTGTSYTVRAVTQSHYLATGDLSYTVSASAGLASESNDFGAQALASIQGHLWNDTNANGIHDTTDNQDPPSGRRVFLDLNGNNSFDSTEPNVFTDSNGDYSFGDLVPGEYHVRRDLSTVPTYRITNIDLLDITLAAGEARTGLEIGSSGRALLSGTVFNDANANGVQDVGEGGLITRVFVDSDNDSVWDLNEEYTFSDADGAWKILSAPLGTNKVRAEVVSGYAVSAPSAGYRSYTTSSSSTNTGKVFTGLLFGQTLIA